MGTGRERMDNCGHDGVLVSGRKDGGIPHTHATGQLTTNVMT